MGLLFNIFKCMVMVTNANKLIKRIMFVRNVTNKLRDY